MSRNCNEEQVICSFVYVQIYNFEQRTYHRCGLARTLLDDKVCDVFNPVSDILLVCFATGLEVENFGWRNFCLKRCIPLHRISNYGSNACPESMHSDFRCLAPVQTGNRAVTIKRVIARVSHVVHSAWNTPCNSNWRILRVNDDRSANKSI